MMFSVDSFRLAPIKSCITTKSSLFSLIAIEHLNVHAGFNLDDLYPLDVQMVMDTQ